MNKENIKKLVSWLFHRLNTLNKTSHTKHYLLCVMHWDFKVVRDFPPVVAQ